MRIFVDMDGVVVDFEGYMNSLGLPANVVKKMPGAYASMLPIPGAIASVRALIDLGFEVWIATKPPTGIPHAYGEKVRWIMKYLPELVDRIIITHDKGLLGDSNDFLCDDRPHKANCMKFAGTFLPFVDGYHWDQALAHFETVAPNNNKQHTMDLE